MTNYPALVKTEQEPEYKVSPPLKISSVGTEIKKNSSQMPDGSALLTDTGSSSSLKNQEINYIIHAVPRHRSSCSSDEEFIEIAVKATQNSIFLAHREGIKKLAICFVAGLRYRGDCDPKKLAEAIVTGALNQLKDSPNLDKIIFVAYKDDEKGHNEPYLVDAFRKIETDPNYSVISGKAKAVSGDICVKSLHEAEAIVNSENAQMGWGGGISEAIEKALGSEETKVDQQRKDLMKEFNDLINQSEGEGGNGGNNNKKYTVKYTVVAKLGGWQNVDTSSNNSIGKDTTYVFFVKDTKKSFEVSCHNSAFASIKPERGSHDIWYKVSLEADINWGDENLLISKDDFFEIEENKKKEVPNQNGNDNNDGDNSQNSDNQNKDNNENGDKDQEPSNNKKLSNSTIPNSVKQYFREKNIKSIELDGENWIITYKDKKKKTISKVNASELNGLDNYLKSKGKKILVENDLEFSSSTNFPTGKDTKYWPWILGIGGILVIGVVAWMVLKNRKKSK